MNLPLRLTFLSSLFFLMLSFALAQTVQVGSGSYTTTFPGVDEAGRNGFPSTAPLLSGAAATKPIPTNDWWSSLLKNDIFGGSNAFAENLFNYPLAMKTKSNGLMATYVPFGVIDAEVPIIVGLEGLNVSKTTVSDFTDWTVTMAWEDKLFATSGIGMPFVYFTKAATEVVQLTINLGTVTINNELITVENARNGADFAIYAPVGSTWIQNGNSYTSTLNGKNYWSMAMLPQNNSGVAAVAEKYKQYAYVFPANTTVAWNYDQANAVVRTVFTATPDVKEGTASNVLLGLLPHQWSHLANDSAIPQEEIYESVRGELKMLKGNSFAVENSFHGILPTLPYLANYSESFSLSAMDQKVSLLENEQLATWTDSYNEGQVMNRLIQTARIADKMGNTVARDKMLATIKERLEDWLTAEGGEVAFLFYYNEDWTTLIGYPAGHGQDNNINDHHFHWGYFIHAAAFVEQFEPGWAANWGDMINLLVRDAASPDRDDALFPFLRNFSPYAGHSWANGTAAYPQGNDQESTAESMQFNSSLIHWGSVTGNTEIRDLGIYLYTTEQSAIEEYWFDIEERIFPDNAYSLVSRVWGNSYDNGTFFTDDISASYGIELYPIHGGSMYLGHNNAYATKLWAEIETNTGILENQVDPDLWHDIMYQYLSFTDPAKAIQLYNSNQDRILKFGVSDAQTYYWLHAMNASGQVDASLTADHPLAVAFQKEGIYTYVAHNYSAGDITVTFSDGFQLLVPAGTMATNRDVAIEGTLSSSFPTAFPGGSVELNLTAASAGITKVAFYNDGTLIGEDLTAPFSFVAANLQSGIQGFYAKLYEGEAFDVSNIVSVVVGRQSPYSGTPAAIPGTIEAGHYDKFEGGKGQGIAYFDLSQGNNGDFRPEEDVDSESSNAEGATVGWINGGEWLEYTVDVQTSGYYELSFRFASDNQSGGGPFHLLLDGDVISNDISLTYTTGWDKWETKVVTDLAMPQGEHVLRVAFDAGEFNLAKMNFTYQAALAYGPPLADAGANVSVILPATTASLDASQSTDPEGEALSYAWTQLDGPSVITFSDAAIVNPDVSNLVEGIYSVQLQVTDVEGYSDTDEVLVIVSETGNVVPVVSITSPSNNASYRQGEAIEIKASASDLEGAISKVEFFAGADKLGEDTAAPFSFTWGDAAVGAHVLTAVATDEGGATATSEAVNVSVEEVVACTTYSDDSQEGNFAIGYRVTFESAGSSVKVIFEMLDRDKIGVQAYLRQATPFTEVKMDQIGDNTFARNLTGLTPGTTISYACKFDFSGGLAVTKYFSYVVGSNCDDAVDVTAPQNFTASVGDVTFSSINLVLKASEEAGKVIYEVTYGSKTQLMSAASGVETNFLLSQLNELTAYDITVRARDLTGNEAVNSPINFNVTTTENTNTACAGAAFDSQQGAFTKGYRYAFETIGTDVKITFELLDEKVGILAFLWRQTPFQETQMEQVTGRTYTATLTNQTEGATIVYACKFAFEGGLAVTKYFSYTVGDNCGDVLAVAEMADLNIYPNPVTNRLTIDWNDYAAAKLYSLSGLLLMETTAKELAMLHMQAGVYILLLESRSGQLVRQKIVKK